MPDLFPTPTRLALLREVAAGRVHWDLGRAFLHTDDCYCGGGPDKRKVTARLFDLEMAGWLAKAAYRRGRVGYVQWDLTDAGRAVLAANPESASTVAEPGPYLVCPDCLHRVYFDDTNQAAGMDVMERHVQWRHPLTDRTPAVLRPRIRVVTGA